MSKALSLSTTFQALVARVAALEDAPGGTGQIVIPIPCGDRVTPIPVATNVGQRVIPADFTLSDVVVELTGTLSASGTFRIDVNLNGTSIFSTRATIDSNEASSLTAAVPPVISTSAMTQGGIVTVDVDNNGDGFASGLVVTLIGA